MIYCESPKLFVFPYKSASGGYSETIVCTCAHFSELYLVLRMALNYVLKLIFRLYHWSCTIFSVKVMYRGKVNVRRTTGGALTFVKAEISILQDDWYPVDGVIDRFLLTETEVDCSKVKVIVICYYKIAHVKINRLYWPVGCIYSMARLWGIQHVQNGRQARTPAADLLTSEAASPCRRIRAKRWLSVVLQWYLYKPTLGLSGSCISKRCPR